VTHATDPLETTIKQGSADFWFLAFILMLGLGLGLMGLVYYSKYFLRKGKEMTPARLAMLISIGIGLHNFSEGLAIGNSAIGGEIKLALLLIVGFGLHNITEAFAISAPLVGQKVSWKFLVITGLIAGGPNFIGTIIGYNFSSQPLSVFFFGTGSGRNYVCDWRTFSGWKKI